MIQEIQSNEELNKGWIGAIANHLYIDGKIEKNVFVHAKLVHRFDSDNDDDAYYEIMIPSEDFKIAYVSQKKIRIINEV